ncbi:putative metal-binding motif-containing protein [Pyxidicoccus trucidator]|uniref:putative metal-binding motif-containing protein n=1 Tax=Pyxidicoccus trucidator TaxID=2709662 RepID=UPI0013DA055A|nr:putative metal-binding motif-containing protein [Pyxidicoccus trucidator]
MKMTKRSVVSAFFGLALAACGPVDESGTEALVQQEQELPAGCTSVDATNMTSHACLHAANAGDNINVAASATRTTSAPGVNTAHKHYTVTLPAGAEGSVTYVPTAYSTGSTSEPITFYLAQSVSFTVLTSGGATVTPGINEVLTASTCSLVKAVTYDLSVGATYILAMGPASGNQVGLIAEYLNDNRVRWYPDADSDTHGANAGSILTACEPPANYVSRRWDCNDSNASINPDAAEICGNGVDDNCDGVTC